ncbi:MAG: hypothetical protein FD143_2236 [Ignavibacteria bacterium]|nr:MAG: hypothetical protein FD143_2236 [Ignavibacteria bacterium]KAF0158577.1 MAG: hypothetical protein FD188_2518 [Ignavibacteria bacterium]
MKTRFFENFKISGSYSVLSVLLGSFGLATVLSVLIPLLFLFSGESLPSWIGLIVQLELPASEVKRIAQSNYSIFPIWGELTISHPNRLNEILSALIPILAFGSISYGIYLLRKLLKNIYEQNYFAKENKNIMYTLGTLCIAIPYIVKQLQFAVAASLPKDIIVDGMKILSAHHPGIAEAILSPYFCAGMLLIIFADVFKEGKKIKEENDLTV